MANPPIIGATYARVSTLHQVDGISLEAQEETMLAYAAKSGITIPVEYRFREQISGLKDTREEYGKIRELVRSRRVSAVIVCTTDRLTRDPAHGQLFRAEIKRAVCTLHVVSKGGIVDILTPEGEVFSTVEDAFNKYWLHKIIQTTQEKKHAYTAAGVPVQQGSPKYGYVRVGKRGEARLEIVEAEAAVIRRIFQWLDDGVSVYDICRRLRGTSTPGQTRNQQRLQAPGVWPSTFIYGLAHEPIYAGTYYAHREQTYETPTGQKARRLRPREDWVAIPVPAIVEQAQWDRVQTLIAERRLVAPRAHAKYEYLLARCVRCGVCGRAMSGTTITSGVQRAYYVCNSKAQNVLAKCSAKYTRVEVVDAYVWAGLTRLLASPEVFLASIDAAHNVAAEQRERLAREAAECQKLVNERERELTQAVEAFRFLPPGSRAAAIGQKGIAELEAALTALDTHYQQLQARLSAQPLNPAERAAVSTTLAAIGPLLVDAPFARRRAVVEALGLTAIIAPTATGGIAVELRVCGVTVNIEPA